MNEFDFESAIEFADNPDPRCACVLVLDTSQSMTGDKIAHLQAGVKAFADSLAADPLAGRRVEVAVVTFDDTVELVQDFITADQFVPPTFNPGGRTALGSGVLAALRLIEERKALYKANGVSYYRPWIFVVTDGVPQGEDPGVYTDACRRVHAAEDAKHVACFAVGVDDADMDRLNQLGTRPALKLDGLKFTEMFVWLSASMTAVSQSRIDDQIPLPPPGWGSL